MSSLVQRVEQHRPVPCRSVPCAALQPHSLHCCPHFVQGCSAQGPPWEQWQDAGLQAVQAAEKPLRGSGCGAGLAVGWIWLWGGSGCGALGLELATLLAAIKVGWDGCMH